MSAEQARDALALTISAYRHGSEVIWEEDARLADAILSSDWLRSRDEKTWDEAREGHHDCGWGMLNPYRRVQEGDR